MARERAGGSDEPDFLALPDGDCRLTDVKVPACLWRGGPADAEGFATSTSGDRRRFAFDGPIPTRPPSTWPAPSCSPPSSTATPISTRAISGRAAQPRRHLHGRADRVRDDREANWSAEDVAAHGFRAALRLRPRHPRDPHPSRLRRPGRPPSMGRVPRTARGMGGRIELQAACLTGIDLGRNRRNGPTWPTSSASSGGVLGT
jgi:hypothetical protein